MTAAEEKCVALIVDTTLMQPNELLSKVSDGETHHNLIGFIGEASEAALHLGQPELSDALGEVVNRATLMADFGGYGYNSHDTLSAAEEEDILFLCSAFLEALKSNLRRQSGQPRTMESRPEGRRGMTLPEKIFAMHEVQRKGWVKPGEVIQVDVDWVLASELSWANGIEKAYQALGRPGIFRNDRFWLAGDHRVEPELYEQPAVKKLMKSCRDAEKEMKMTDFQGFNYTIMHTEFVRERAQPGMLCIGADSHTCSAGAASCLSIGLGATDVALPLITGQTWFTVPETLSLKMINAPPKGIGGKDIMLYILQQFKRNTIAADRVVEFSGPGLKHLSRDARFAISNMCTEFGAVTGVFEADEQTLAFVNQRPQKKHRDQSVYLRPDEDAEYAEQHIIDLAKVESFVAIHPSPDNVVSIGELATQKLDGCFIGACTTAEEDLIMGALVLEAGFASDLRPVSHGRRVVVPGSRPISHKLEKLGFLELYRKAGFKVGIPGCSMCVGQGVDQALPGETWLSSQNRNFKNRMGPGSYAYLGSAATVAASSFTMEITNPQKFVDQIDLERVKDILGRRPIDNILFDKTGSVKYEEPFGTDSAELLDAQDKEGAGQRGSAAQFPAAEKGEQSSISDVIEGRSLVVGDFVDTDAIIPSKFLAAGTSQEVLGTHCMEFFMPEFRNMARNGQSIVVGGRGFGVGSSRDVAVNALKGCGVKAVIAKSFAFIYARNQPNLGLLGITLADEEFHRLAQDGESVRILMSSSEVECGGKKFPFQLSNTEKQLIAAGGMTSAFTKFGRSVFNELCKPLKETGKKSEGTDMEDFQA